jgi:hypothetical protein
VSRLWLGVVLVPVISAEDDATHLVRFRLYEEGLTSGEGRYAALCGKNVLAAAMSDEPTRECPLCRAGAAEPPWVPERLLI